MYVMAKIVEETAYRERSYIFQNRSHAGDLLAQKLQHYASKKDVVLLAIPAGGVPVGYALAQNLDISMDVIIVRKIQVPWNTEAGFGAVTWDGDVTLNDSLVSLLALDERMVGDAIATTKQIILQRMQKFRGAKALPIVKDHVVLLVDDGLASGFTMLAAVKSVRKHKPKRIVVAVPTAPISALRLLTSEVEELVCLNVRSGPIFAVADAYQQWYDLDDGEVIAFLDKLKP
jgi:predicted phosphoribosyltransferase